MKLTSAELQKNGKRSNYTALLGPWVALLVVAGGIAALFSVVTTQGAGVSSGYTDDPNNPFYCDSRGSIRWAESSRSYNEHSPYWDGALFLSVNMGIHDLTFSQAKAIDICFDLFAGRGSQIIAALATYPLLRRAVLRSMEIREFSLALLLPFFLERLSANTLWALVANMRTTGQKSAGLGDRATRSRFRVDWRIVLVFLVGSYILSLPTFLSAMTSYQVRNAPYIPIDGGTAFVSTANLSRPDYVVEGAEQLGLPSWFPLFNDSTDPKVLAALTGYDSAREGDVWDTWVDEWRPYTEGFSALKDDHGPNKPAVLQEMFNRTRDSLPATQYFVDTSDPPLWSFTVRPRNATYEFNRQLPDLYSVMDSTILMDNENYTVHTRLEVGDNSGMDYFAYENKTVYGKNVEDNGKCLPANGYIWGFSSLMLFTFCMLTIVVATLLIVLHYDAYCYSHADRYKLYVSPYRDVLDLAQELSAHFGAREAASMPAEELDNAMDKDPATTGLETVDLHPPRALRWRQSPRSTWPFASKAGATKPRTLDRRGTEAEESLMSIGLNKQASSIEMGKMPAKAVTKQFD